VAAVVALTGALGACATSNVGTTHASNLAVPRLMAAAGPATPPAGFLDFCARSPKDCGLQAEAGPALAPVAMIGAADAPAAGPRPPHGGYDWSAAFAAARPAPQDDQTVALRQKLYSRHMWQAAFAAARPQPQTQLALAMAETAPAAVASVIEAPSVQPAIYEEAPAMSAAPAQPELIRAAYVSPLISGPWSQPKNEDAVAMSAAPAYDQAPAAGDAPYAVPAMAVVPAAQPLVVTRTLMAELVAVDRRINRAIVQVDDVRLYGQDDYWATPIEDAGSRRTLVRGDCEDYVLEKRRALIAAGFPVAALSIAVADTRFGPHAVLLVDTDKGELVLDSLTGKVTTWDRTGYRWIKRQAWGDPMSWVQIAQSN
jgi:predicted transglutaminase-like cysteine proteinase